MSSGHCLRALLTLCVALALVLGVLAENPRQGEDDYFHPNDYSLVPADNVPMRSLTDLKTGVYSIQLSGERSDCGLDSKGPGMVMMIKMTALSCETHYPYCDP